VSPVRHDELAIDEGLASDPRLLCDARLLAGVHAELGRQPGDGDRRGALLRAGFLHGLRDASGGGRPAPLGEGSPWMAAPALAIRLAGAVPTPGVAGRPLAVGGSWPTQLEAEAVMLACGRSMRPACLLSAAYTSGWLSALWDADVLAVERTCAARGDGACTFEVRDAAGWTAAADPAARLLLPALPFGLLRDRVARERREAGVVEEEPQDAFDPASPAVHVWGPVMVVPYAGDETAVAVEAVSRQPAAAGVTVVVVDLQGAIVDDGFGAVALERIVEVIEARGAEPILAGISPLSARVVEGLGRGPVVTRKDLRSAIALAFQIAESQRHTV
jgi:anti-anti-sigma regulatory factor